MSDAKGVQTELASAFKVVPKGKSPYTNFTPW
jgi:hypothetical protein